MLDLIWLVFVGFWATADWEVKDSTGQFGKEIWFIRLAFVGVKLILLLYWVGLLREYITGTVS